MAMIGGAQSGLAHQLGNTLGFNGQNGCPAAQLSSFIQRAAAGQIGAGCRKSGGIANSRTPADTARLQKLAKIMGFKDCGCGCKGAKAVLGLLNRMQGKGDPNELLKKLADPELNPETVLHNEMHTQKLLGQGGPPQEGGFRCMGFSGGNPLPSGCCCGGGGGGSLSLQMRMNMNLV